MPARRGADAVRQEGPVDADQHRERRTMTSPGVGLLHGVRALVLASVAVGLSLVSHDLAGGARPGFVPLVVLAVLTTVVVRPLARCEVRLPVLLAALGVGQIALHQAFGACAALSHAPVLPAHRHDDGLSTLAMLGAHALATVAVALVLRHGDGALWRLWSWLAGCGVPARPRALVVLAPLPASAALPVARRAPASGTVGGRAPPVLA
ncbi:hypothetical protein [Cellulosimicrobium cellulans]|uniref:hypothetical protein n=1 Tax=Cellulosimicrobium cellulans TaxID=1710 RepID=UPI002405FCFE|nr:hypothetical protein [Cellulosimicrobium cellulans]MDF9875941.1 hypothetical protein [Cellulosimicrobium cellulans]